MRNAPTTIAGTVNADGTIKSGSGFSVTRTATGNYTLRLPPSFRALSCTATVGRGGQGGLDMLPQGSNVYGIFTFLASTGAFGDYLWSFVAVGSPLT